MTVGGARFVRADLHVHTMLGPGETAPGSLPTVNGMITAAKRAGVSIIAITDHNSIANVDEALSLASGDLLVIPGLEITAADGDVIGLFDPGDIQRLRPFGTEDNLKLRTTDGAGSRRSTRSVADLVRDIGDRGGLAILAHVDTADGWLNVASPAAMADVLADHRLVGIEITQPENVVLFTPLDADQTRRQLYAERRKLLTWRAPLARLMSSDAHSPEQVGMDAASRMLTRLRLDTLTFGGVKAAIAIHPDSRCRLEAGLTATYSRLTKVSFEGGFLGGVVVDMSPNLNCFIGGRGSGKSTALLAIQAVLRGFDDTGLDDRDNMPDHTIVEYMDVLGTPRKASRRRYSTTTEEGTDTSLALEFVALDQNFGSELQADPAVDPTAAIEFLSEFLDLNSESAEEASLLSRLEQTARTLRQTTGASAKLKMLDAEKVRLSRMLTTASDKNLTKVADYAAALAAEQPLLEELERQLAELERPQLPTVPNIAELAAEFEVDLKHDPAAKFVPGEDGLSARLEALTAAVGDEQEAASVRLGRLAEPSADSLRRWKQQHEAWRAEVAKRSEDLRASGFTLQVEQLDRISRDLKKVDEDIRRYQMAEKSYRAAQKERKELLTALYGLRQGRFERRRTASRELARQINAESAAARVTVRWTREGRRTEFAGLIGQLTGLHSPRKDRCAAAVAPRDLAAMVWSNNATAIRGVGAPEVFFDDPEQTLKALRTFDTLFELETMDLPDVPEIRVRLPGDPPNVTRALSQLSLGQLRSVLLGFLLRSPGNAPLILDQPEEQLDGAFVAKTVVPYLHGAKEQRQVIIATHNANIVVLGDSELVLPLAASGRSSSLSSPGSVDDPATQAELVEILEGGREAFEQRGVRYGIVD